MQLCKEESLQRVHAYWQRTAICTSSAIPAIWHWARHHDPTKSRTVQDHPKQLFIEYKRYVLDPREWSRLGPLHSAASTLHRRLFTAPAKTRDCSAQVGGLILSLTTWIIVGYHEGCCDAVRKPSASRPILALILCKLQTCRRQTSTPRTALATVLSRLVAAPIRRSRMMAPRKLSWHFMDTGSQSFEWQFFPVPASAGTIHYLVRGALLGPYWTLSTGDYGCEDGSCNILAHITNVTDSSAQWVWASWADGSGTFYLTMQEARAATAWIFRTQTAVLLRVRVSSWTEHVSAEIHRSGLSAPLLRLMTRRSLRYAWCSRRSYRELTNLLQLPPDFTATSNSASTPATATSSPPFQGTASSDTPPFSSSTNTANASSAGDSGLSSGVAAAIGVGATLLVLLAVLGISLLLCRRKKGGQRQQA